MAGTVGVWADEVMVLGASNVTKNGKCNPMLFTLNRIAAADLDDAYHVVL